MFEKFIATLIGRKIVNKLHLYEGAVMPTKPWYQSKAVWSAILMAFMGAIQPISAAFGHPIAVPGWIINVLTGLGIYGIRTGDTPIA